MQDIATFLTAEGTPERCGIIKKDGAVLELPNVHEEPTKGFRMGVNDILEHFGDAEATWHTHPGMDPNLSEDDFAGFSNWPDLTHYIVGVRDGEPKVVGYKFDGDALVQV